MPRRLELFDAGTPVVFGEGIRARVAAVTIRGPCISYEVVWYIGAERYEAWVPDWEVRPDGSEPSLSIGFG